METPVTPSGLRKYDQLDPVDALIASWTQTGPNPEWHERARNHVRNAMPLIARGLDRLVKASEIACPVEEEVDFGAPRKKNKG